MKKIITLVTAVCALGSFQTYAQKSYATLSGKLTNKNSDFLMIVNNTYKKKMVLKEDGTFSDTLKIETGSYILYDGKEQKDIYLKNGSNLNITADCKKFDETIKYSGEGAQANNYLAQLYFLDEKELTDQTMFDLKKEDFEKRINEIAGKYAALLKNTKNLDAEFIKSQKDQNEGLMFNLKATYEEKEFIKTRLAKGTQSPKFLNYENNKGGTTSLDDLKGKYVYIDLWATWCGPCKAEIPYLKKIEKEYHDKNIVFVSISVDEKKDAQKWKVMVASENLSGIQLLADNNFESDFIKGYKVESIPRFILLDPEGKIVSALAPRPSEDALITLFNELKI
jgi:thiol-disulfide isomerase/thioredoxin